MVRFSIALSVLFTYMLMVMGNVVTTTGSGLACPDWPLCYGSMAPPMELGIWIEWGHRLLGGTTGILILISVILTWIKLSGAPRLLTTTALGLLGVGATFGGVIVLIEAPLLEGPLHLAIISFHIIIATLIFSILILSFRSLPDTAPEGTSIFYPSLLALVFIQVFLGIFVRYGQATLACPDFPLCRGVIFPDLVDAQITLHFFHRFMALTIFLVVSGYLVRALKAGVDARNASITFVLVIMQGTFGAYIIWSGMFFPYIVLHGATGFFILGWVVFRSAPYLLRPVHLVGTAV